MINYKMPLNIIPDDEALRLNKLNHFEILNTPPETDFDAIAILAAEIFDTENAHICFVDKEHVFIKASLCGSAAESTLRESSLCALSILKDKVSVYSDVHQFYELADSPFLADAEDLRFYAAAPIRASDGSALGTVCVTDDKPHLDVTEKQLKLLELLADTVLKKMETRLINRKIIKAYDERLHRMSHDLKNPVTSISLYAQLLGSREMSAEKVFSMAAKIETSAKKIEKSLSTLVTED